MNTNYSGQPNQVNKVEYTEASVTLPSAEFKSNLLEPNSTTLFLYFKKMLLQNNLSDLNSFKT